MATINGTLGDDLLSGTPQADLIYGLVGNDTLLGNQGNDSVLGNQDNDLIFGGKENDALFGGKGNDTSYGNLGNDTIYGNEGDDVIYGGKGNDAVYGGKGNDRVFGDLGDDTISGDLGSDTMTGGEGRDLFVVGRRTGNLTTGSPTLANADYITDFTDGQDQIGLQGISFDQLEITGGTGQFAGSTIIRDTGTGDYLAILPGVSPSQLTASDFVNLSSPTPTPTPPTPTPTPPTPTPTRPPTPPTPTPTPPTPTPTPPTPTPTPAADLSITKTDGLTSVDAGDTLTYTIVATNAGPSAVTNAVVTDNFPTQLTGVTWTATGTGGASGFDATGTGNLNDTAISLPSGATVTYIVNATVNPATAQGVVLTNSATITSATINDPNQANNTAIDNNTTVGAATPFQATDDTASGRLGTTITIPVLENDTGTALAITGVTATASDGGAVTIFNNDTPNDPSDDQLQYLPTAAGTNTITYTLSDGAGNTDTATLSVIVTPAAEGQTIEAQPGVPTVIVGSTNPPSSISAPRDTLQGSTANDTLVSGRGPDILTGGAGADEFRYLDLNTSGADPDNPFLSGDVILDFDPTEDQIRLNFEVEPGRIVASSDVLVTSFVAGNFTIALSTPNTEPEFLPEQFIISLNNIAPGVTADTIRNAIVYGNS